MKGSIIAKYETDYVPGKGEMVTLVGTKQQGTYIQRIFRVIDLNWKYVLLEGDDPVVVVTAEVYVD